MPTADELLGPDEVDRLVATFERAGACGASAALREAGASLAPLPLRARSDVLRDALLAGVPGGAADLERVVRAALDDDAFTGWQVWPVTEAVTARALEEGTGAAFDAALALLADLTSRLTAEMAIRPLLAADLERALAVVVTWVDHPDEHVRRLASEGTRPFLPWATRVPAILAAPSSTVPILDALYRDPSEYVRRSVGNHLNDLNRQEGELAVAVATRWLADPDEHTPAIVRRGLRSLIKRGDRDALAALGFEPAPEVVVSGPVLGRVEVAVGEQLPFEVVVENGGAQPARLVVDYVIHHVKADGRRTPKVFKLATLELAPGEVRSLARRHSFRPISTRTYHPGEHAIEVQVNGVVSGLAPFELSTSRT